LGVSLGKSRLLFWLGVAFVVLVKLLIVPMIPTQVDTDFVTRYIPISLAPLNWVLGLALLAICMGPLLMPRYLSIPLNVLCVISVLFFLGSWRYHPVFSPVIGVLSYVEMNWLIPWWETIWINWARQSTAMSPNATILKIAVMADGRITMDGLPMTIDSLRASLEHFHKSCSVFGAKKETLAVDDRDGLEGRFGSQEQIGFRSWIVTAEDLLDLAPHRFDGIEVRRIGRQI
jgi:hypothetical protein